MDKLEPPTYQTYGDPHNKKKEDSQEGTKIATRRKGKKAVEVNEKKTYQSTDRVTVLGLVCEKMAERVVLPRQEGKDRRAREEVSSLGIV